MDNALSMSAPAPSNSDSGTGNALSGPGSAGAPQAPQGAPQQAPAPSHQQTVAALRHFSAIERELGTFLRDPDLGKSDLRSKFIDGATKLVTEGIMTPAQAVSQLGTIPERPFGQKKWVEQAFAQTIQGANAILDHHRAAFAGMPPVDNSGDAEPDHQATIQSLMSHYQGLKPNG